ncbi:type III-B CRISPR module-associated Cmr3 family protein [Nocardiopsis aegyptia]|uniref:CRISPR-associated protein Cmr3 n=1 Tax=Nocardiopsis aegyptia TaxID=220378 RepID=A0A7Z0EIR8_9ACTN|nr:type III-B CRISPR module-associated Cmr3 family protein [Nocardiopsis aegyptia]NYJ32857.1 CRISPR-associated protein Cmr3 [Nocardiopsis aegyptia]
MTHEAHRRWLALVPRDTVQVRDGRSFDAGAGGVAHTVRPWPSTVAGALVPALGGEPESVRGPVLAQEVDGHWTPHLPVPLDLVRESGREDVWRLRLPEADPGVSSDLAALARPHGIPDLRSLSAPEGAEDTEPLAGLVPGHVLRSYLHGELEDDEGLLSVSDLEQPEDPLSPETRVGLGLDPNTRTAKTGLLYTSTHLRLAEDWAFCAEVTPTPKQHRAVESPAGPVRFGGLSRLADVAPARGLHWPDAPLAYPEGKVLVYVATPAVWERGWLPPLPPNADLVAACVGDPLPVATASPVQDHQHFLRTRTLMWAVPPGSVYYLKFLNPDDAEHWVKQSHRTALGPAARKRLDTAGFGVVLTGVWS